MTLNAEIGSEQLRDLVKQVQAGNEVVLTLENHPVARLVPPLVESGTSPIAPFKIRSFKGHRVLTPLIRQESLADELFPSE